MSLTEALRLAVMLVMEPVSLMTWRRMLRAFLGDAIRRVYFCIFAVGCRIQYRVHQYSKLCENFPRDTKKIDGIVWVLTSIEIQINFSGLTILLPKFG
mgnify:CR=1 FL=1